MSANLPSAFFPCCIPDDPPYQRITNCCSTGSDTHHNRQHGRHDNHITAQKRSQALGAALDLPGARHPPAQERSQKRPALNVEPLRKQKCKVVGRSDGIGRNVGAQSSEAERKGAKEFCGAILPAVDNGRGVPIEGAIDCLTGRGDDDADKGERKVNDGDKEKLPIRDRGLFAVSRQIGLRMSAVAVKMSSRLETGIGRKER